MNTIPKVIFFGSFIGYSVSILESLIESPAIDLLGVVTTPPKPAGRKKELHFTDTHLLAKEKNIPVFAPEILDTTSLATLPKVDYFIVAGYGKLLPVEWLEEPKRAALNVHFSVLPKYRGANPAEWALLFGETTSGVSIIEMSAEFDTGAIVATCETTIDSQDTRESLYKKLYQLAATVTPTIVERYHKQHITGEADAVSIELKTNDGIRISYYTKPIIQTESPTPYARRLKREDGFVGWGCIAAAMHPQPTSATSTSLEMSPVLSSIYEQSDTPLAVFLERTTRALSGFPGIWTLVQTSKGEKRMKILSVSLTLQNTLPQLQLETVQIEGQQASSWNQVKNTITNL